MNSLWRMLSTAGRIAWWDTTCELRRPTAVTSVALFGAGALIAIRLAIAGGSSAPPTVAVGGLWVVLLFGAMMGVGRALAIEREEGTFDALLLAPVDRSSVYLGKVGSALIQGVIVSTVLVPLCWVLLSPPQSAAAAIATVGIVGAATLGFSAVGVLGGILSMRARGRELLNAAIFVPLTLPLIIVSVTATLHAWGVNSGNVQQLIGYILCYDGIFLAAGVAATPLLVVE